MDPSTDTTGNGGSGLSSEDWLSLIQLGDADLMSWYALTHSNTPAFNQAGISIGPTSGGYAATAGLSSLLLIGLIAVGVALVLR